MFHLSKTLHFEAAHWLPEHPGKCKTMHGHRWEVTIHVSVRELNEQGMVVDFHDLKAIIEKLDHGTLNDHLRTPTAEYLAQYVYWETARLVPTAATVEIEVAETPGAVVRYTGE